MDFTLYNNECMAQMKTMEDNSVDSCVCDPPYGLQFMGKAWDYDVPKTEIWREVFRVLKPGGHLLSFFGSRTYHRGVVQIEDAGFEIRDQIMWLYGSGFPKSHNVGKGIDREAGATRKVIGIRKHPTLKDTNKIEEQANAAHGVNNWSREWELTEPNSDSAKQYEGWGSALKPSHEPIVVARKPLGESTIAKNVLKYGTGAINIDECRVEVDPSVDDPRLGGKGDWSTDKMAKNTYEGGYAGNRVTSSPLGRWPANVIHDGSDEVVEGFPHTKSGIAGVRNGVQGVAYGKYGALTKEQNVSYGDEGTNARFFYCAKTSKEDRDEGITTKEKPIVTFQTRGGTSGKPSSLSAGRDTQYKNNHPTVKPTALMQYLCRLVTPKNGTVLDPFMGSGSTGKACAKEGFSFIGIEMDKDYFAIAKKRIEHAYDELVPEPSLADFMETD